MVKPRPILSGADLRDAVLSGAVGNKWTMLPDGWQVTGGATVALDDVRSPMWWAAFLLTLILIGAVSWTWAGEVER